MSVFYGLAHHLLQSNEAPVDGGIWTFGIRLIESLLQNSSNVSDSQLMWDNDSWTNDTQNNSTNNAAFTDHFWLNCCDSHASVTIIFTIIWVTLLIFLSCLIGCIRARCSKPQRKSEYSKRPNSSISWIIIDFMCLLFSFICLILLSITVVRLGQYVRTSVPNHLCTTLNEIQVFTGSLARDASLKTESVLQELINNVIKFDASIGDQFNDVLQDMLGVKKVFQSSENLTNYILTLFEHMSPLAEGMETNAVLIDSMKNHLSDFKDELRRSERSLGSRFCVEQECERILNFFISRLYVSRRLPFFSYDFAKTFIYLMASQNETADTVKNQLQQGYDSAEAAVKASRQEVKVAMNLPEIIRDTTRNIWNSIDSDMKEMSPQFENVSQQIEYKVKPILSEIYTSLTLFFFSYILISVVLTICVGAVHLPWLGWCNFPSIKTSKYISPRRFNQIFPCVLIFSCIFIVISLTISGTLYLITRYAEQQACRYIRPANDDDINVKYRDVVDHNLNRFFQDNWAEIENFAKKQSPSAQRFPLPRPRNILRGVVVECQKENATIFTAFDAIRDMDLTALDQPELGDTMINKGREVMLKLLVRTDPREMMPSDTTQRLKDSLRLDMFVKKEEYLALMQQLQFDPLVMDKNESWKISVAEVKEQFSQLIEFLSNGNELDRLEKAFECFVTPVTNFTDWVNKTSHHLQHLSRLPSIVPIVTNMNTSLHDMMNIMSNQPRLLKTAAHLFDEKVVPQILPFKTRLLMEFAPQIMSKVASCGVFHDIYVNTTTLLCEDILGALANLWLFIGTYCLLQTIPVIVLTLHFTIHEGRVTVRNDESSHLSSNEYPQPELEKEIKKSRNFKDLKRLLDDPSAKDED